MILFSGLEIVKRQASLYEWRQHRHMMPKYIHMTYHNDVNLAHLPEVRMIRFIHWKVTLLCPLPKLHSFGKSYYPQPMLREWGVIYASPPWGQSIYAYYLEILCVENLSSLLFTYLFNHWFTSIWTHRYLFHTSDYNPMIHYL